MTTVRVWFTKTGEAAYISLLDLQRVMQRALKRARLPVWYTQGFNPHIYMTFAAPLALGQESLVESLDCKMEPLPENWQQACAALQACLPAGICAVKIEPAGMDPSEIASAVYEVRYPVQMRQDVLRALRQGMEAGKGYVFATSNCVYTGMALERYEMMLDIWREYGNYDNYKF